MKRTKFTKKNLQRKTGTIMEALRIAVYIAENYHSSSYTATNDARERERERERESTRPYQPS